MKTNRNTLDRTTPKRTIVNVRRIIRDRLKQLGQSRHWLAEQVGVRPATVYDFLSGKAAAKVETIEKMFSVLRLDVKPKD